MLDEPVSLLEQTKNINNSYIALEHANNALAGVTAISDIATAGGVNVNTEMLKVCMEGVMCQYNGASLPSMEGGLIDTIKRIIYSIIRIIENILSNISNFIKSIINNVRSATRGIEKMVAALILNKEFHLATTIVGSSFVKLSGEEIKNIANSGHDKYITTPDDGRSIDFGSLLKTNAYIVSGYSGDKTNGIANATSEFHANVTDLINRALDPVLDGTSDLTMLKDFTLELDSYITEFNMSLVSNLDLSEEKGNLSRDFYSYGRNGLYFTSSYLAGGGMFVLSGDPGKILTFSVYTDNPNVKVISNIPLFKDDQLRQLVQGLNYLGDSLENLNIKHIEDKIAKSIVSMQKLATTLDKSFKNEIKNDKTIGPFINRCLNAASAATQTISSIDVQRISYIRKLSASHRYLFDIALDKALQIQGKSKEDFMKKYKMSFDRENKK